LAPFAIDYMRDGSDTTIVLVVVPLVSLMKDQVNSLQNRGIVASYVGDDCSDEQLKDIIDFAYKSIRLQADSPTLRSIRLHDLSCFAYT